MKKIETEKDPFQDPFFTDPDYMRKSFAKSDSFFKKAFVGSIVYTLILCIVISFVVVGIVESVRKQGGVGKAIGNFINDVKGQIE